MGMTIDEAIKIFNTLLAFHNVTCTIDELEEVCKMAIDSMSKYQKIEDIYYHQTGRALEDSLRSVIEDGKIDKEVNYVDKT